MEYSKKVEALNSDDEFKIFISEEEDREKSENALKTIIKETQAELKTQKEEIKKLKLQETKLNNIQIETARKMKEKNIDLNSISEITGLTLEEIESL